MTISAQGTYNDAGGSMHGYDTLTEASYRAERFSHAGVLFHAYALMTGRVNIDRYSSLSFDIPPTTMFTDLPVRTKLDMRYHTMNHKLWSMCI